LIVLVFFSTSCGVTKTSYDNGVMLEESDMYAEASNYYYDALRKDEYNVDINVKLKHVGQIVLDKKFENFKNSLDRGNKEKAIYEYVSAVQFRDKLHSVNVNLRISDEQRYYFSQVKLDYLEELLNSANELLYDNKFIEAKIVIDKIILIYPENHEVRDLEGYSIAEPIYRMAMKFYSLEKYKEAYEQFNVVLNYKNAREMRQLSKDKTTIRIVILPIVNKTSFAEVNNRIGNNVHEFLSKYNDHFFEIITSSQYKRLLLDNEKVDRLSGGGFVAKMPNVVLELTMAKADRGEGKLIKKRVKGWEVISDSRVDNVTKEEYFVQGVKKVYYYSFVKENSSLIEVNYLLRSVSSGDVLLSKSTSSKKTDNLNYIEFEGDNENLRKGYWLNRVERSPRDRIITSRESLEELHRKLYSPRNMRSCENLEEEVLDEISKSIVLSVKSYVKNNAK
ncbi:MAG: hypothetical protein KAH10_07470, partial [Flavobacteriales bacterium]|nr:hypothetical protein [Flavobacteriales bacterium]